MRSLTGVISQAARHVKKAVSKELTSESGTPGRWARSRLRLITKAIFPFVVVAALALGFCARTVINVVGRAIAGLYPPATFNLGNPPVIPLKLIVVDDSTGHPLRDAKVDMPFLHSDWRNSPDLTHRDMRID